MTQGLPNRPRIDPSRGVPYTKVEEPVQKETLVDNVSTKIFKQKRAPHAPQSKFWTFVYNRGLNHYFDKIDAKQDRKVLYAIFGDTPDLNRQIKEHAPLISEFATEKLLSNDHWLGDAFDENPAETEKFFEHLLGHVILNAALKTLPPHLQERVKKGEPLPEKLKVEDVIGQFMKQMIQIFGKDFNEIDKQAMRGKTLDAKLISPTIEKFYDYLFPEGDSFRSVVDDISRIVNLKNRFKSDFKQGKINDIADLLGGFYQPFFDKLQGKKVPKEEATLPLPGEKESKEWMGRFLIQAMATSSKKEDIQFLKSKGIPDPELIIKQMSPSLSQNLLKFLPFTPNQQNGKVLDQTAEALLLHAVASVAKATGKNRLNPDTLLEDVFSHLSGIMRGGIDSVDPKNVDSTSFSATSLKLMSLFIPPHNEWALDFLKRRDIPQKSSLNQFLFQMHKASVGEKEVKERLLNRIGNQEGVEHLEALCNSIASLSRVKMDEFFSNPEKVNKLLKGNSKETANLISGIFTSKDSNLQWFGDTLSQAGGSVLLKGLTHFLEKIPYEEGESLEDLCFASFKTLLKTGTDHLPDAPSFIKEFTSLFYSPEKLESQGTLAGIGFEWVQEKVASELALVIDYSNKLLEHKGENQKRLETLYRSDNPVKMGELLGHVARRGIPSAFNAYGPECAKVIVDKLADFIELDDSQKESIGEGIALGLNKIGSEKLLENTGTLEFLSQFSEAAFCRFMLNFSEGIQKLEKQGNRPLVDEIAMLTLKGLSSHLKNLGEAKEVLKGKKIPKEEIQEAIYDKYEEKGVLAPEIRNVSKREEFYEKLSEQLFMLFETDLNKQLPEIAANIIENMIVPSILEAAVVKALSPETMQQVLSNLLENAANASESSHLSFSKLFPKSSEIKRRMADKEARKLRSKEEYQKEIAEVLSELIKNAVSLQPSDLVRKIGRHKGVRKAAAKGIADTLCAQLKEGEKDISQVLFLLNKMMGGVLEALPSEKNPETGETIPNLKPFIAETVEEKKKLALKTKERIRKAEKNVPKFLSKHIHLVASAFILNIFFEGFDKIEEIIETKLPRLSRLIVPVLQALIKVPLFILIFTFNIIVSVAARAAVRLLFHASAQELSKNIKYGTPENFAYDLFKKILKDVDMRRGKI